MPALGPWLCVAPFPRALPFHADRVADVKQFHRRQKEETEESSLVDSEKGVTVRSEVRTSGRQINEPYWPRSAHELSGVMAWPARQSLLVRKLLRCLRRRDPDS